MTPRRASAWAIVVAAGEGTRLKAGMPKALVPLAGRPLLAWSLDAIAKTSIEGVVVAAGASWVGEAQTMAADRFGRKGRACVGGATRRESVRLALARVAADASAIVVHDAARPLAGPELFERALEGLSRAPGAVCAVPLADTLKRAAGDVVAETLDRNGLWRVQTPQAFRTDALVEAHAQPGGDAAATDDAALLEAAGLSVVVVPGDERNFKVTTPGDLAVAEAIAAAL